MSRRKDLTGQRFGKLVAVEKAESRYSSAHNSISRWLCKCDCSNMTVVDTPNLTSGHTTSCGNCGRIIENNKRINKYDLSGEYGIGYFSNVNEPFYFDLSDYETIKGYLWSKSKAGYVVASRGVKGLRLHRLILNSGNYAIDHINGNKADNRKCNLRICSTQQNAFNKTRLSVKNTSGHTGITFLKNRNKWKAQITVDGKLISLGNYDDKDQAIAARLEAERKYFGEFAPQRITT